MAVERKIGEAEREKETEKRRRMRGERRNLTFKTLDFDLLTCHLSHSYWSIILQSRLAKWPP